MFHVKPGMQFGMLNWTYATEVRDNRPCLIVKQKKAITKKKKKIIFAPIICCMKM